MNSLSAFRLLIELLSSIVLLCLVSVQCKNKVNTRKVEQQKGKVRTVRSSQEGGKKKGEKKTDVVATPKQSNEDVGETPIEQSAATPAPTKPVVKSSRKKSKTEKTDTTATSVDPTQLGDMPNASTTLQVCATQDEEVSAKAILKTARPKFVEQYFEDQNDDDTLGCVKSIEG